MIGALVVMTILGCDDSVSQCHYISTVKGNWTSVSLCDAESQKQLPKFSNHNYPVVVAMCDVASSEDTADTTPPAGAAMSSLPMPHDGQVQAPVEAKELPPLSAPEAAADDTKPALPRRVLDLISGTLPDMSKLRAVVTAPVHSVQNGYSWVARKFEP